VVEKQQQGFTSDYLLYLKITKDLFKICLLGDGGVGKSTFIHFLSTGQLAHETNIQRTPYINIDGCNLGGHNLQIYDLAGQRREDAHPLDHLRNVVLRGTDIILFFFALDNLQSFLNIKNWFEEILLFYKDWENEKPVMLLVGNKLDLPRKVEAFNGQELAERVPEFSAYFEISLATAANLEAFLKALCDILDQKFHYFSSEEFQKRKTE